MKNSISVLRILHSICEHNCSRSEMNNLIELAYKTAYTYLNRRNKGLSKVLLAEDITLQEMAIDSIAPLFARDEAGDFVKLIKAFENWTPKIDSEETAQFFVNRLIARSVDKYISEILRESDPFFSKILDTITYLIEKVGYRKHNLIGTTYIVENENFMKTGALPDSKFINELPLELFYDNINIISKVFDYIKSNTDKAVAIPLNALVMKIKSVVMSEHRLPESYFNEQGTEVDSILNKALNTCIEKMNVSYVEKNKISEIEADRIRQALINITNDLRDGGINSGLHKYLLEQFPQLNFKDYEEKYQNLFEYLFKILKKEIAEQLKS